MSEQGSPNLLLRVHGNHGTYPTDTGGRQQAAGAGATLDVPVRTPPPRQGSWHDPPPRDTGTTGAQPLRCPASPAALCHPPPKALPGVPLAVGGLTPSPGPALPSCGSPKTNPCFPERQILASDSGQHFSSSWPRISASNYRHKEPASAAADPLDYFSWQMTTPSKLLNH